MPDSSQTVPPFIPGLVIVILLIVIALLIGWRRYARRMNPQLIPVDDWEFYEGEVMQGGSRRPEKPRLWEVGVGGRTVDQKQSDEGGWATIMPLSAMSLTSDSAAVVASQTAVAPESQIPFPASRFPRLKLLSSGAKASSTSPVPPPPTPLHRLQVSVLISMPSLPSRTATPPRDSSARPPVVAPADYIEEQHNDGNISVDDEEEGAPDVAFGIVVLPWRKAEDDEVGQTTIST